MAEKITNKNLPLLLAQARENVLVHFRPILKHYGLTEQQWRVLRLLSEEKTMEPCDLCEGCQILSPSMAGILRRLEEMKLIKRSPVKGDKRRVLISLTQASKSLIQEMVPHVQQQYRNLEDAWGKELVAQLYEAIEKIQVVKEVEVESVKLSR